MSQLHRSAPPCASSAAPPPVFQNKYQPHPLSLSLSLDIKAQGTPNNTAVIIPANKCKWLSTTKSTVMPSELAQGIHVRAKGTQQMADSHVGNVALSKFTQVRDWRRFLLVAQLFYSMCDVFDADLDTSKKERGLLVLPLEGMGRPAATHSCREQISIGSLRLPWDGNSISRSQVKDKTANAFFFQPPLPRPNACNSHEQERCSTQLLPLLWTWSPMSPSTTAARRRFRLQPPGSCHHQPSSNYCSHLKERRWWERAIIWWQPSEPPPSHLLYSQFFFCIIHGPDNDETYRPILQKDIITKSLHQQTNCYLRLPSDHTWWSIGPQLISTWCWSHPTFQTSPEEHNINVFLPSLKNKKSTLEFALLVLSLIELIFL